MMKVYQGIDIVAVPKFRDIMMRNSNFLTDIFSDEERLYCNSRRNPSLHLAGHFAAKESFLKALGRGLTGIDHIFREIVVTHDASGKPGFSLSGWARKTAQKRKIAQWSLSISHSGDYAVAAAILIGEQ